MTGVELFAIGATAFTVGDALMVVGAISSIVGGMQQAQFEKDQARFNADVARENARAHRAAAQAEGERAEREARLIAGQQRATFLANGVTLEGTPIDLMTDTEIEAQLDRNLIIYEGEINAITALNRASVFDNQAKNAGSGLLAESAGTLLTVGAKAGTKKAPSNDNKPQVLGKTGTV